MGNGSGEATAAADLTEKHIQPDNLVVLALKKRKRKLQWREFLIEAIYLSIYCGFEKIKQMASFQTIDYAQVNTKSM